MLIVHNKDCATQKKQQQNVYQGNDMLENEEWKKKTKSYEEEDNNNTCKLNLSATVYLYMLIMSRNYR